MNLWHWLGGYNKSAGEYKYYMVLLKEQRAVFVRLAFKKV